MTAEEKLELKKAFEERIDESRRLVIDLREASRPMEVDSAVGRISRMDYINNKSISEAELEKVQVKLRALERWLSLYDTAQFGKCTRCGQEIDMRRLLLLPESTRCIRYASR